MKKNENGFSVVEGLLVVVVIGLVGAVSWLVYDRQKSESTNQPPQSVQSTQTQSNESPVKKKTSLSDDWVALTSLNKKFLIALPDGWTVTNDSEMDHVSATGKDTLIYKQGTPATINKTSSFRGGGGHTVSTYFAQTLNTDTYATYFNAFTKADPVKTKDGLSVEKYTYTSPGGDMEAPKGSITTGYAASKNGTNVVITYTHVPGESDQTKYVEESIKTLVLY